MTSNPSVVSRILICGGRDFDDWQLFRQKMHDIAQARFRRTESDWYGNYLYDVTIITGAARGADRFGGDWAAIEHCLLEEFPAAWEHHGRAAGPIRNRQMLKEGKPDLVIAFPGGNGTANMVKQARQAGVEVIEIEK